MIKIMFDLTYRTNQLIMFRKVPNLQSDLNFFNVLIQNEKCTLFLFVGDAVP